MGLQVCAPWAAPEDLCNEGGGTTDDCVEGTVPLVYKWTDEQIILAASNILYNRTCRRYPGLCTFEVWPCIDGCWSQEHVCVRCFNGSVMELPGDYKIQSITSVTEDGVELDPSSYRLERGNRLVRMDGLRWQTNTFGYPGVRGVETIVTFVGGEAPPIELRMAAAALADELKKSCNGQSCGLDARVTSYSRRGVSVELTDLEELLKSGATGIPIVDHALKVYGNCGGASMYDPARRPRGQAVT